MLEQICYALTNFSVVDGQLILRLKNYIYTYKKEEINLQKYKEQNII